MRFITKTIAVLTSLLLVSPAIAGGENSGPLLSGTTHGTFAAGDDMRLVNAVQQATLAAMLPGVGTSAMNLKNLATWSLNLPSGGSLDITRAATPTNTNVVAMTSGGNLISFCPQLSCARVGDGNGTPTNDHQRTSALFSAITGDDGHSEEQTVAVMTTVVTGQLKNWAASTSFSAGDNVAFSDNRNSVYREIATNCTSASSGSGPSGFGSSITDGTCVWSWINAAAINGKVGIYTENAGYAGGGAMWGQAVNTEMMPGYVPNVVYNVELDLNNKTKDCNIGVANCNNLEVSTGGEFINTTAIHVSSNSSGANGEYGSFWGLRFNSKFLAKLAEIEDDSSAAVGLAFNVTNYETSTHSVAAIQDASLGPVSYLLSSTKGSYGIQDTSNTPTSIRIEGSHASGSINDQSTSPAALVSGGTKTVADIWLLSQVGTGLWFNGAYTTFQIQGVGWNVNPTGDVAMGNLLSRAAAHYGQFYSGQTVQSALVYDIAANSATVAEQTGVFRMTSNTGKGSPVSNYKMALGAETILGPNSAAGWAMTSVLTANPGYSSSQNQVTHEIDHNNNSGTDCPDADLGKSGTVPCGELLITGAGSNQVNFGLAIAGYSKIRNGILFPTGGPIATSIDDLGSAQVSYKDAGSHINGIDASTATYTNAFIVGPAGKFVVGPSGGVSASGSIRLSDAISPDMQWNNTAAPTDNKLWTALVDGGGTFHLRAVNDAFTSGNDVFYMTRTGATPNGVTFITPISAASLLTPGSLSVGGMATIGASVNNAADMPLQIRNAYAGNTLSKTATMYMQLADTVGAIKNAGAINVSPGDVNVINAAMQFYVRQGDVMSSAVAQLDGTGRFNVTNRFSSPLHTPATSSEACAAGDLVNDAQYQYVCTAANHWRRSAMTMVDF